MTKGQKERESLLRIAAVVVLALLGMSMLAGTFFANNPMYGGQNVMGRQMGMGSGTGFSPINGVQVVLTWIMHLLWVFVLVALIIGAYLCFKKLYIATSTPHKPLVNQSTVCGGCGLQVSEEFRYCPNCKLSLKSVCDHCSKPIRTNWKCCPYCGTKKANL